MTVLDDTFVAGGGLTVGGALRLGGIHPVLSELRQQQVFARLADKDDSLWGEEAQPEASKRLGWLDLPESSRDLPARLAQLRAELLEEGLTHVVLCGMGGSSLAPEVICRTLDVELTILDTTDPGQISAALGDRLEQTIVVVSSKSGGTIETDSQRRAYWQAFIDAGIDAEKIGQRFVVVTDPGSPLASVAESMPARAIFLADPTVGGRYSALSAFGLVPAALAGVDVQELLDQAREFATTLREGGQAGNEPNSPYLGPAAVLGTALGVAAAVGKTKLILAEDGSGIVGIGDWIEQLIAESTGKNGTGILPVVVEQIPTTEPTADEMLITVGGALTADQLDTPSAEHVAISVNGPLGAQFLAWEYATAIAGRLLQINPFDQPNVAESKENTSRILTTALPVTEPVFSDGAVEVYGEIAADTKDLAGALLALTSASDLQDGYLAIMAYLDRTNDAVVQGLRSLLAAATGRPVTFGWGPRFLHSTGQYHKGGQPNGVFLQLTGGISQDIPVPGQSFTFGQLQAAQAAGDMTALATRGRPVLRLHLTDRPSGIAQLLEAAR